MSLPSPMLTPGRYVGAAYVEDDGEPFEEKMARLTAELAEQFAESARLEAIIRENLRRVGYERHYQDTPHTGRATRAPR